LLVFRLNCDFRPSSKVGSVLDGTGAALILVGMLVFQMNNVLYAFGVLIKLKYNY